MSDAQGAPRAAPRFIPREEVGNFSPWRFADIHGQPIAFPGMDGARPTEKPGYDDGYAAGLRAGHTLAETEFKRKLQAFHTEQGQQLSHRLGAISKAYEHRLSALEDSLAGEVLVLALDLTAQLLRTELQLRPDAVAPLVEEAVRSVLNAATMTRLRLHPDDWAVCQSSLQEYMAGGRLECVADESVTPGGCEVECGSVRIDATLETRWRQLRAQLGQPPQDAA